MYVKNDGLLMAAPFDERSLRAGPPVLVLDSVSVSANVAAAAVSANGSLAYIRGGGSSEVVAVDTHGQARVLIEEKRAYAHPRLSPDGRRIAFDVARPKGTDVWLYDFRARTFERLSSQGISDRPEWTPDGKRVLFSFAHDDEHYGLWWKAVDASAPAESLYAGLNVIREGMITPDGHRIYYRSGRKLVAATVESSPTFAVTGHEVLFEGSYQRHQLHPNYDVARDGKSFIMLRAADDARPTLDVLFRTAYPPTSRDYF